MIEKALSIRQPWSWLIVHGLKDVENRSWPTKFRGRVYVHAGLKNESSPEMVGYIKARCPDLKFPLSCYFGGIIGEVDIVDCRFRFGDENDNLYSKWHEAGMYGFYLANPVEYEKPIPCKGQLGFFKVGPEFITAYSEVFRDK